MRYAVIDMGSNTIRLGIYDYENNNLKEILNEAVFANLAGFIRDGVLSEEGISVASKAVKMHKELAAKYSCDVKLFATAAIRNAKNTSEICTRIEKNTGIKVDVLSGEEEARFSFYGAVEDFPCTDGIMADVGGGSSEIIVFSNSEPVYTTSIPWGSLKVYKNIVSNILPTECELEKIRSIITNELKSNFLNEKKQNFCIVGGGVKASKKLAKAVLNENVLSVDIIDELLNEIIKNPDEMRKTIENIAPKRLNTIAPALAIYSAVGNYFGAKNVFISDKGIKEGYIYAKNVCVC